MHESKKVPTPRKVIDFLAHKPQIERLDDPNFDHVVASAEDAVIKKEDDGRKKEKQRAMNALYKKVIDIITSTELECPLSFLERRVLRKRFGIGEPTRSHRDIADELSYSPGGIFVIEMRAIGKLRELLTDEERKLFDGED